MPSKYHNCLSDLGNVYVLLEYVLFQSFHALGSNYFNVIEILTIYVYILLVEWYKGVLRGRGGRLVEYHPIF